MKSLPRLTLAGPRPWPWPGLALLVLAAAALAGQLVDWQAAQARRDEAAQQLRATQATPRAKARPPTEAEKQALAQARTIAAQLGAPWFDMMAVFEQHTRADIGLLRLEPDARSMHVKLQAEARNQATMLTYLQALEADPRLADVLLVHHQVARDMPGQPVRFMLKAAWREAPATAADPAATGRRP